LNRGGKLEILKKGYTEERGVSSGVSEVQWKGQCEIRNSDCTVYYSGSERTENVLAIMVHKIITRIVVKKIVYSDRSIALNYRQSR